MALQTLVPALFADAGFSGQYIFFRFGLHDSQYRYWEIHRYSNTFSDACIAEISPETQIEILHHQFEIYIGEGDSIIDYQYRYRYYLNSGNAPDWSPLQPHYYGQFIHASGYHYGVWSLDHATLLTLPLTPGEYYLEFSHSVRIRSPEGDTLSYAYATPDGLPFRCRFRVAEPLNWGFADSMRSYVCLDSPLQGYPDTLILWNSSTGSGTYPFFHTGVSRSFPEELPVYLQNIVCRSYGDVHKCSYFYRIYENTCCDTPAYIAISLEAENSEQWRGDDLQIDLSAGREPGKYILELFGCSSRETDIWTDCLDRPPQEDAYRLTFEIISGDSSGTEEALPVCLAWFSAARESDGVRLSWQTESEVENRAFRIYRDGDLIAEVEGAANSSETRRYSYTDHAVVPGHSYTYLLSDVGFDNCETLHREQAVTIHIEAEESGCDFTVGPAYPNPFNPVTVLPLNLMRESLLRISIHDLSGRFLDLICDGRKAAGSHSVRIDASAFDSGIYFVLFRINGQIQIKKIILIK